MTMQEALDIIAMSEQNKGDFGMSEEEQARRQTLIRGLATSNPELARQVASGPYQMNVGNSQVGDTATPQEGWQRGPAGGSSYSDQARSQQPPSQMRGAATPSTTGPMVAGQPPSRYQEPTGYVPRGTNQYGTMQGPPNQNGQYQAQPGQVPSGYQGTADSKSPYGSWPMPAINININGQPQGQQSQGNAPQYDSSGWSSPQDQFQLSEQDKWRRDNIYASGSPQPQSSPPPPWMTQASPDFRGTTMDQAYGSRVQPGLTASDFPMQPDPNYRFPQFDTRVRQPLPQTYGNLSR